ncbi:uncharacterized protein LOC143545531 [Bidens hawaiensis]|uniref:uncharacterized protein LOC143545531 n=1 Tax=Bidens hawaiensis TaxID=980011 RepID=UPI00404B2498
MRMKNLIERQDYLNSIRAYNSMFAMTSFGAKVDHSVNNGSAPYVFKVQGQISHWLGSMCPVSGQPPRFLQMYVYDTANEIRNRLTQFNQGEDGDLKEDIVRSIVCILDDHNELVKLFRTARDLCSSNNVPEFHVCLYNSVREMSYDIPVPKTIGAIVHKTVSGANNFDIVVHQKDDHPQHINKLNSLYMPLQYPLLFIYGQRGWSPNMRLRSDELFRSEFLQGIYDAMSKGDTEGHSVGRRVILPSSFTGGPRYMYKHYHDALAICRVYGNPQYFITFTCNVKWPEIVRFMSQFPCLKAQDRPDIISRIFQLKVEAFRKYLKHKQPFGSVIADLYTIEFQKRGLPHCHILIWVSAAHKIIIPEDHDRHISAVVPDPNTEPELYKIFTESMMHGPCGLAKPNAVCMKEGTCSKSFPKRYQPRTTFDKNGYVHYKRPANGFCVKKNGVDLDNAYVVPYNKKLCMHFNAHINVEYCGGNMLIKYLFKYISKGTDRVRFKVSQSDPSVQSTQSSTLPTVNEIDNFVDGRYICPHEAAWRILNFPIHHRYPAVQTLAVHLENMQTISFRDQQQLENIVNYLPARCTTLTEWFANNEHDASGRHLRYIDYLSEYRWYENGKCWIQRLHESVTTLGRLVYIHPSCGESFYLRMLLSHQVGCTSFADVRTVNGTVYDTYRTACENLGLLMDDNEWSLAFAEAKSWATAKELRNLFAHILLHCEVSNPVRLWENQWRSMAKDFTRNTEIFAVEAHDCVPDETLHQYVLYEQEFLLNSYATDSSLKKYGLPMPNSNLIRSLQNRLLMEEKNYDREELAQQHNLYIQSLHPQQQEVYDHVTTSLEANNQVLAFVYGHGGTGKTFLWTTITSYLRSQGKVVLTVAASGIASLLLPSGRTAHSRFKIPIDLTDNSNCNISKNTQLSKLLVEAALIIWDEAPMSNRKCFEALDRSLKDILDNNNDPFGGKSILLGGDFRQTLPIRKNASKSEIISSSLARSYLWSRFKIFRLTQNMRVLRQNMSPEEEAEITDFSNWLLDIGNGLYGFPDDQMNNDSKVVHIPERYIIPHDKDSILKLVQFIYDNDTLQSPTPSELAQKAIVCPKNRTADLINDVILNMLPGTPTTYRSTDLAVPHTKNHSDLETLYPSEYLNTLNISGFPPHELKLKVNVPIILLRNINQKKRIMQWNQTSNNTAPT